MSLTVPILQLSPEALARYAANQPVTEVPKATSTWYGRLWSTCTNSIQTCKKVAGVTLAGGCFVASTVLRGVKYTSFKVKSLALGTTLSSLGTGVGVYSLLAQLPEHSLKVINQISMDLTFPLWFTLVAIELMFAEEDSERKEELLTVLASLVGYNFAISQYALFQLKMRDMPWNQHIPLTSRDSVGDNHLENVPVYPLFLHPTNPIKYVLTHGAFWVAAGITILKVFENDEFGVPLGLYFITDGIGLALGEILQSKYGETTDVHVRQIGTGLFIFLEGGWGIIVTNFPSSPYSYAFMGISTGITKSFYKHRFERMPFNDPESARLPSVQIVHRVTQGVFAVAFAGWVVYNIVEYEDLADRVALIVSAGSMTTVFLIKEFYINRKFKPGQEHHPIVGFIKFYTEDYTVPAAVAFTFIELFNGMGSRVLAEGDIVKSYFIPDLGWTVYMIALGGSLTTVTPRMPVALSGLSNTYIGWLMQGRG